MNDDEKQFTFSEAHELYTYLLSPGVSIRSDVYGDWFVAEVWDTDISVIADTPIEAARIAVNKWKKLHD